MAAASSSERPPPWVILGRLAIPWQDDAAEPEDVSVALAAPPRVSTLTVPTSVHPDPINQDNHPYIVAADAAGLLLLHLDHWPFIGFDLGTKPHGNFLVVRGFVPAVASKLREPTATAVRVPDRRLQRDMPAFSSIKNVGLVSRPGSSGADYIVAELQVFKRIGADRTTGRLLYFRSGTPAWVLYDLPTIDMIGFSTGEHGWIFDDAISHDGKLWWVSLRWGLISCDFFVHQQQPAVAVSFYKFPQALLMNNLQCPHGIDNNSFVRVSNGKMQYVEISRKDIDDPVGTAVLMYTLLTASKDGTSWWMRRYEYETTLEKIWADQSYRETGMPEEVPVLAALHPGDPCVLYFFLRQRLFGVNVQKHRVVEFVDEQPGNGAEVAAGNGIHPPPPLSWRNVLAWELPSSLTEEYCFSEDIENVPVQNEELENLDVNPPAEECGSSVVCPIVIDE